MDKGDGVPRVLDPQLNTVLKWERSHFETFMRRVGEAARSARAAIDAEDRVEVARVIAEAVGDRGAAIVTHDLDLARRLATRAVFFAKGRIAMDGPLEEVVGRFAWDTAAPRNRVERAAS